MLHEVGPDALDSLQKLDQHRGLHLRPALSIPGRVEQRAAGVEVARDSPRAERGHRPAASDQDALWDHGVPSSSVIWPQYWALDNRSTVEATTRSRPRKVLSPKHLRLTCLVPPDLKYERIALELKRQLAAVGVDLVVLPRRTIRFSKPRSNAKYEAVLTEAISAPSLLRPYQIWHSGGAQTPGRVRQPDDRRGVRSRPVRGERSGLSDVRRRIAADIYRRSARHLSRVDRARPRGEQAIRGSGAGARPRSRWARCARDPPDRRRGLQAETGLPWRSECVALRSSSRCSWRWRPWCRWSRTAWSRSGRCSAAPAESVIVGNQNVATRAAEEIHRYVATQRRRCSKALAADLQDTGLEHVAAGSHPQELRPAVPRVPRDHAVRRSRRGRSPRAASASRASSIPKDAQLSLDGVAMSPIRVDDDLLPTSDVRHPPDPRSTSRPAGWSASSASKRCGGWSIRSASATAATRWSSRRTAS